MLCFILNTTLCLTFSLALKPSNASPPPPPISYNSLALPCPSSLSSTFPPQGYPLLLSWLPAAHCEVGSRLLSWALTALLCLALMQVAFELAPTHISSLFNSICLSHFIFHCHLSIFAVMKIFTYFVNKSTFPNYISYSCSYVTEKRLINVQLTFCTSTWFSFSHIKQPSNLFLLS